MTKKLFKLPKSLSHQPSIKELGRISKTILDNISKKLFKATNINPWKNAEKKILIFDIKDLYPSITQNL